MHAIGPTWGLPKRLGVNIDHVATLRQARKTDEPDPVWAAAEAQLGGADGITLHLREDRRHIQERDLRILRQTVTVKLNLEMAATDEMVRIAAEVRPDQCCLVPEKRQELTTEGGLDVAGRQGAMDEAVSKLHAAGIFVSAFIEPKVEQVQAAAAVGFDAVELWTGGWAHAKERNGKEAALVVLHNAITLARQQHLEIHAGHGLTYHNIQPVARLGGIVEFNIGHSIIARSVFVGLREAVREMKALIVAASFRPEALEREGTHE